MTKNPGVHQGIGSRAAYDARATIKRMIAPWNILKINAQLAVDIFIKKGNVLGRNLVVSDSLGNQISVQNWRTGDTEPRVVDHQVSLEMNRAKDIER